MTGPDRGALARLACLLEVTARKPGNVHRGRDFDDAHFLDFLLSAAAVGDRLSYEAVRDRGVGRVVLEAVEATRRVVAHNTNLGMVLLLTPLVGAPEGRPLREGVSTVLAGLTVDDARDAYAAIRLARPGGLGSAPEQDVSGAPGVTLLEAMRLAADRDLIARQYAHGFADVFDLAVPELGRALTSGLTLEPTIVACHLTLMAALPDTLIARKLGPAAAEESARRARAVLDAGWPDSPGSADALDALDAWLRTDGHARNPGATADLTCAALYAALHDGLIPLPLPLFDPARHVGVLGTKCQIFTF